MPRTIEFNAVKGFVEAGSLEQLASNEGLRATLGRRGGLVDVVGELLGEMDAAEAEWFASIPRSQQEAIRAVIHDVIEANASEHLEIQYTPAYDYSVTVLDYDRTVVIRVGGPLTGSPSARSQFGGSTAS